MIIFKNINDTTCTCMRIFIITMPTCKCRHAAGDNGDGDTDDARPSKKRCGPSPEDVQGPQPRFV